MIDEFPIGIKGHPLVQKYVWQHLDITVVLQY
jgi:hypothetical protein